jgi:hypothetical protein
MEDLFAANPRNLKLPTTGPALLPVCPSLGQNPIAGTFPALGPYLDDGWTFNSRGGHSA